MNAPSALLAQFRDTVAGGTASPAGRPAPAVWEGDAAEAADTTDPVVSAAVLVAAAFRLRDEAGLIATLRLLTEAVTAMEARQQAEEEDGRAAAAVAAA